MKPKPQPRDAFELFQAHFDQLLDPRHEPVVLANKIDWHGFGAGFTDRFCADIDAPGKAVRLMVGLRFVKYAFDESAVARWVGNPYGQYFCGYTHRRAMSKEYDACPTQA